MGNKTDHYTRAQASMRIYIPLLVLVLFLPLSLSVSAQKQVRLIEATDLSADSQLASSGGMPILLLVSQDHCPFCIQLKEEILHPMLISGEYNGRLLMREIFIDLGSTVVDFHHRERESAQFTGSYGVYLTPTLLFLGPDGTELTERIIGIQTPEMFFFYVDKAIQEAIKALQRDG